LAVRDIISSLSMAVLSCCVRCQVEDIEAKIDLLLDMYKEHRPHRQSTTPSAGDDDVSEHRQLPRTTADEKETPASSERGSPRRSTFSEPATSSRDPRAKPMLRNLSDLGPRAKKRVTYSRSDTLAAITLDYKRPPHVSAVSHQQPSIVSEEDQDSIVSCKRQTLSYDVKIFVVQEQDPASTAVENCDIFTQCFTSSR